MPYGLVQGNHDTERGFDATFPIADYTGRSWFGGSMPGQGFRDSYELFTVGGLKFIILHLEYDAPAAVMTWADGVLEANRDRRAIISTHDFLTGATRSVWGSSAWTSLVSPNCNVFLVLNGHTAGEESRSDTATGDGGCSHAVLSGNAGLPGPDKRRRRLAALLHLQAGSEHRRGPHLLSDARDRRDRRQQRVLVHV